MAWTQTDIDRLKAAMATGARKVAFGSGETRREQEFRSLEEMERLLARMESEVLGVQAPATTAFAQHSRD
ncbi:ABC-type xylose transport system substrate-binding protein [Bosea sp. OAE506]|uniref:phage head-tail joining protein n=1 Tax=Bosea sp. OAE506 TaxID=2663870 RepID=UPI00178A3E57